MAECLGSHADAAVADFEVQRYRISGALVAADPHRDLAVLGEFHRIADQVDQDLSQAQRVAADLLGHVVALQVAEVQAFMLGLGRQ